MIMEYAEGGELFDYIIKKDHLSEAETRNIFHQIIDAIDYMHKMGICHRDLKPENILLDSSHTKIKIIDFGLSNLYYTNIFNNNTQNNYDDMDGDLLETPCGSPGYAPPEMVLGYNYNGLLTDIWSSGIILYAMLCGSFPFDDDSEQVLYSKIIKGIFEFPSDIILSKEVKNLVKKILVVNPNFRASIKDIKKDPWFSKDYKQIYGLFLPIQEIPVDDLIINEMEKNGYKKEEIIKNIKNNRHNNITTFYYLLVKKFGRKNIDSINDLISPTFTKYILEQNEKIKNLKNYKVLINLKLIFEKLKLEEESKKDKKLEKEMEEKEPLNEKKKKKIKNINLIKKEIKDIYSEGKKENESKLIKNENLEVTSYTNRSHYKKNNNILEELNQKEESNINKNMTNISQKKEKENYTKNINKANIIRNKENHLKDFRNMIFGSLHKNKKFKKLKKILDKKEMYKNYIKKLKINNNSTEKTNQSNNKKELKNNNRKEATFNLSFPFQEKEINNTLISFHQKEKNLIFQGFNSSRYNTDRINYDKLKPNIKTFAKKVNIPLYQKFKLNINENRFQNIKTKNKTNHPYVSKVVKNSKTSSFNTFSMNKNKNNLKNINITNKSIKNLKSKNVFMKNMSLQKEKDNNSYKQIPKDKNLIESNLSRIMTVSEGKSNSNSKGKTKVQINNTYSNSSRNKYMKNDKSIKKFKNNGDLIENNFYYKKIKKYHIENKKDNKSKDIKINSNKSNDNNFNFSININLNLNNIKNQKSTTIEQSKHQNIIKSYKDIKLDLKNNNNNNSQLSNRNSLSNSDKTNFKNIFKLKQDSIINKKNNFTKNINFLNSIKQKRKNGCHSKEENKIKKMDDLIYKNQENYQKSFQIQNKKYNIYTNSLSKILPFLKNINTIKKKSIKKSNLNNNTSNNNFRKSIGISNNSNSIIVNKINLNTNYNFKKNSKVEQIKKNQKLVNCRYLKSISNNLYNTEILTSNYSLLNQGKYSYKKSIGNIQMKPLNLKGLMNDNVNFYTYRTLTMRGEQNNNKFLIGMKDELSKSGNNNKNKIQNKDEIIDIHDINKISPSKNIISKDTTFNLSPFEIKNILMNQLPKYNISIIQKISKTNFFVFHCSKGLNKIIIELFQIKGNNNIFVQIKFVSGNHKEFAAIRKQIITTISNFKKNNL